MARRKRHRRRKNPVDINRYGDLFYDMAAEFDKIVTITMAEVFEGDEVAHDPDMMPIEKVAKKKKMIAATIVKAWLQMQKGR